MDADGNGVPCETVYPAGEVQAVLDRVDDYEPALSCRRLVDRGAAFDEAVVYWVLEGAPPRMDADGNAIPCETVYGTDRVAEFIWFDR
jgi:hypothetical protein